MGNLDSPTALLTNRTSAAGKFIALQLVGISSAREAIGTTVEVKTSDRTLSKQLVAGDGYQASNERQMIFGVGDADVVDIAIRWPSGRNDAYKSVPTADFWTAIEGRRELLSTDR